MLVVDLHCSQGHQFEGWFASADELASQQARGLVTCPVCGDHEVVRLPSAPRLNTLSMREQEGAQSSCSRPGAQPQTAGVGVNPLTQPVASPQSPAASADAQALRAMYLQVVRHVLSHTEDVGARFAQEARDMHHGDAPERPIRGQASADEKQALREEGIEVWSLPVPDGADGQVH